MESRSISLLQVTLTYARLHVDAQTKVYVIW